MATLMVTEKARLKDCERTIERGMSTFVEVGKALADIRDSKLYRDTHKTFQAYVKQRWGHDRDWAYKLIDASGVSENVFHGIQNAGEPMSIKQARELAKAPPEKQAEIWQEATKDGAPTAAKVKAAVQEIVYADEDDEPEYVAPRKSAPQPSPIFGKLCELWQQAEPATRTRFRLWIDGECS